MTDPKPGAITHVEYSSSNVAATRRFLEAVYGWKFTKAAMPEGEYWTFDTGTPPLGGLTSPMGPAPPGTMSYILVASVTEAEKKIAAHGGKILVPRREIPKVGFFAVYEAPGGIVQAVFEPQNPRGRQP